VHVIEQRVMARDNLLQIASKFGLFQYRGEGLTPTMIVEDMRGSIHINQIDAAAATSRPGGGVIGFTVSFEYRDPTTAARVTNELVSSILSQNVESRLNRASETSNFFQQQKADLEQRLKDLEDKIASYRQGKEGEIPETLDLRRAQLTQINEQISAIDQRIALATTPGLQDSALYGSANLKQMQYDLRIKKLQLQSDQDARDRQAALIEKGLAPANSINSYDTKLAIDHLGIDSIEDQIAGQGLDAGGDAGTKLLAEQRAALEKQAAELSHSIQQTPLVQVALNAMNRDYENLQAEYRQAQAKLEDAQTGERLEQDRQAERFEVIEQATVPDTPTSPDRPRIMLAGVFGGLAFGVGLVVLRQMLDKSVYTAADLERHFQIRPIATIPYVVTRGERWRKRWLAIAILLAVVLVVVTGLVLVDIYYLPLDVLANVIWQRIYTELAAAGLIR
jgi:capsular polysaccharide biosynthesis protein